MSEEKEQYIQEQKVRIFGARYKDACIANFRETTSGINRTINAWTKAPRGMLVFIGNPGIGKTYLCASLTEWAKQNFRSWRYYTETRLLSKIRDGFEEYTRYDYLKEVENLLDDELIMLDDVGVSQPNDWRREVLFYALDFRYNKQLPTIITSNNTRADFTRNYGERFSSRLFAKENTIIESFTGYDFRSEDDQN